MRLRGEWELGGHAVLAVQLLLGRLAGARVSLDHNTVLVGVEGQSSSAPVCPLLAVAETSGGSQPWGSDVAPSRPLEDSGRLVLSSALPGLELPLAKPDCQEEGCPLGLL